MAGAVTSQPFRLNGHPCQARRRYDSFNTRAGGGRNPGDATVARLAGGLVRRAPLERPTAGNRESETRHRRAGRETGQNIADCGLRIERQKTQTPPPEAGRPETWNCLCAASPRRVRALHAPCLCPARAVRVNNPRACGARTLHTATAVDARALSECIGKGRIRRVYFRATHRLKFQAADLVPLGGTSIAASA